MESQPIVQWVKKQVEGKVNFLRVDIATPVGKEVMAHFKIPLNSAYVIFDSDGKEVWRSFTIPFRGRKALRILEQLTDS